MERDIYFMQEAIKEAHLAAKENEVPVGAVIVKDDEIIARAHNMRESKNNVIAHAELLAISRACEVLGRWILDDCSIYVTAEPCLMCAGAIHQSRIKQLYYGVKSPKYGVHSSVDNVFDNQALFHNIKVTSGICDNEISKLMKEFFVHLRD